MSPPKTALSNASIAALPSTTSVQSPQGARKAISDKNGYFIIPFLTPGTYALQVVAAGFSTVVQDSTTIRFKLKPLAEVGQVSVLIDFPSLMIRRVTNTRGYGSLVTTMYG